MNKIKYILIALIAIVATGCVQDKVFDELKNVPLKRCLEPMNLSARVDANTGVTTTFRWDVTTDAEEYLLEVLDAETNAVVLSQTLTGSEIPFETNLEADGKYTFRVTAKSSKLDDSKVAVYDGDPFKTYAIKDNLFLKVTGKSAEAISLVWSNEVSDFQDVTHIEATPTAGGKGVTLNLTDADASAAMATLTGLAASTEYDIVLFFKSASRGAVTVWTSPNPGDLSLVSTTEALLAAMTAGDDVYVAAAGSPYAVGSVTPAKGFRMLGQTAADGSKPVIQGDIVLNTGFTGNLYFENIKFDGTGRGRVIDHKGGALSIDKISFVNCEIANYNCGIYYDNAADQLDLGEFLIEGCDIYGILGSGGDGFDVRQTSAINKITLKNSTIWDGFRSFFRLDEKKVNEAQTVTLGEFDMENNTIKNVAVGDKGILYIRCPWTKLTIKKNLFLFQTGDKAVLATTNAVDNVPGDIDAADNYCFTIGEKFFGETKNFTETQVAATVLTADPCFNAKGNYFYLSNADLQDKQVGAAKWWNAYVEPVEDLTQTVTEAPHTWNLNDASLFAGDLNKAKVRDNLLMVASDEFPMNLDGGLTFGAAAPLNKKGVPSNAYAAFLVNGPGSVILKVAEVEAGSQLLVAVGDPDGAAATVKGAAVAGDALQKIILADIAEESMVYLYASGPVKVTTLAWSPDVAGANTALAAPKATIDVVQITEGDETPITIAWEAVTNAADYTVTFNKKKTTTEELSFVIDAETAAALEAGLYTITVVANPAESDIYNTSSEAASVAFAVMAPAGSDVPVVVEKTLTWDFSDDAWRAELAAKGAKNTDITNWVSAIDGLTWTSTAKSKWNTATINEVEYTFIQAGGKGSASDRTFVFTAPASGTLRITASNTGGSAATDDRRPAVIDASGSVQLGETPAPASTEPKVYEFEVAAGTVTIYPDTNGLRFYKIEFTYMETSGGEPEPVKEDYVWDFNDETWRAEFAAKGAKNTDITNWVSAIDGLTWTSTAKSKWNTATINEVEYAFIQAGGKGSASDRTFTFTVNNPGTVTVLASNTGGSAATDDRRPAVIDASGEVQLGETPAPASTEPKEYTFEVVAGAVTIYPDTNGLRFYKIEFHSK